LHEFVVEIKSSFSFLSVLVHIVVVFEIYERVLFFTSRVVVGEADEGQMLKLLFSCPFHQINMKLVVLFVFSIGFLRLVDHSFPLFKCCWLRFEILERSLASGFREVLHCCSF